MAKKIRQDEQVHLAHKRTELAHERTIMAYFRTSAALILFGMAFLGFKQQSYIYAYGGWVAIVLGVLIILAAIHRAFKHQREIKKIEEIFQMKLLHKKK